MNQLGTLFFESNPVALMISTTAYFFSIYMIFTSFAWLLAKVVSRPIETKPIKPTQIRSEVTYSLRSILCFGLGILVPWAMIKFNITSLQVISNAEKIIIDSFILIIWNDIHFYFSHRLLHEKFKKSHGLHHQSHTATPFSAYSMSITEALLLGSVMPIAMPFHNFSLVSLLFLPVWSILINTLAHSNCNLFPNAKEDTILGFIKHHQSHHSHYHGNYSFFFHQLDQWLNTDRISKQQGNP